MRINEAQHGSDVSSPLDVYFKAVSIGPQWVSKCSQYSEEVFDHFVANIKQFEVFYELTFSYYFYCYCCMHTSQSLLLIEYCYGQEYRDIEPQDIVLILFSKFFKRRMFFQYIS